MKHKIFLSVLAAIVIFATTTTADAGIFGRLSVVWNGCTPCEQVACQPCEPIACQPCEPMVCQPSPCDMSCGDICGCGYRPFRPFGGLLANMKSRLAVACAPACAPCEPIACQPCEPIACDPCCDPCAIGCGPCLPFNGFFMNLKARLAAKTACCAVGCAPCEPVCEPCEACR